MIPHLGCISLVLNSRSKLSINQRPFGLSRVSQKEIKIYFTK